jgi:hypothetical protein
MLRQLGLWRVLDPEVEVAIHFTRLNGSSPFPLAWHYTCTLRSSTSSPTPYLTIVAPRSQFGTVHLFTIREDGLVFFWSSANVNGCIAYNFV